MGRKDPAQADSAGGTQRPPGSSARWQRGAKALEGTGLTEPWDTLLFRSRWVQRGPPPWAPTWSHVDHSGSPARVTSLLPRRAPGVRPSSSAKRGFPPGTRGGFYVRFTFPFQGRAFQSSLLIQRVAGASRARYLGCLDPMWLTARLTLEPADLENGSGACARVPTIPTGGRSGGGYCTLATRHFPSLSLR